MRLRHTHLLPAPIPSTSPPPYIPYTHALHIQSLLTTSHLAHKSLSSLHRHSSSPSLPRLSPEPPPHILTFQTTPTYTTGRRDSPHLTFAQLAHLTATGATHHPSSRGGLTTYHGPGQLTAFLILSLSAHSLRPANYVHLLEEAVMRTCAKYGVETHSQKENPGVWTGSKKKICSVGVHLRRGVSAYGVGLNVEGELVGGWFERIVACGIEGVEAVGLREKGRGEELGQEKGRVERVGGALAGEVAGLLEGVSGVESMTEKELVMEAEVRGRVHG